MNPRISTQMMYQQSMSAMLKKQVRLDHLSKQLSTQQRLVTAKDDPVAAGTAIGLDRTLAALDQFGKNANFVQTRLAMQENALQQAGDVLARVKDLTIEANNSSLAFEDRKMIARELETLKNTLLDLANNTDGSGRYLFAGSVDANAPFVISAGQVSYHGDQVQRQIEIAPDAFVKDVTPGSEIFMRIRGGDGLVDARAVSANTGTGIVADFGRSSGDWAGEHYRVQFTSATTYDVIDTSNGAPIVTGATHEAGEALSFAGLRLRIDGEPAAGDIFEIGQATTADVFSTIEHLVAALDQPALTPTDHAVLHNALQTGLRDVACASDHFINARGTIGAQLKQIDTTAELRAAHEVTLKTDLSAIRDLDMAQALGDYQVERIALQAAQSLFMKMQGMSLFERM